MRELTSEQARAMSAKRKTHATGSRRQTDLDAIHKELESTKPAKEVLAKLAEKVEAGEIKAIALWLAYLWGRPVERAEISGPDGNPIAIREIVIERPIRSGRGEDNTPSA